MIVKIVSWTKEKAIQCDDYEITKVSGGSKLHLFRNGVVVFEQIMEDWMGDENVRVYVTEAGKNVDSYSYFSKNKKGEPENGQPMPFNKFIDENPAEAFLLACKGLYSKGMFIEHETDAVECTIPIDKTNNACVIMSDDALNELMSD